MKRNMMKKLSLILSFAIAINAGMFLKIEKIEYVLAAEINGDLSLEEGAILEIPRQDRILNAKKMWEIENQKNIESLFRLKVKGDINLSVPGFRQKEKYYCGPATTKQTLAFFLKSNQVPDQDTLANKYNLRTTTDGTDMTLISGVINKYLKKYSSKIKYSMDNIGTQEEWKKKVLKSLSNNKPVILDINSSSYSSDWGYYTSGHFLNVSGYRVKNGEEEIKVTDPALLDKREKWHSLSLVYKVNNAHWRKSMIW